MKRYLFIGSHPDDCELLYGATIAQAVEAGHDVTVLTLSKMFEVGSLYYEWSKSMEVLKPNTQIIKNFKVREFGEQRQKILQLFYDMAKVKKYDYVFSHSPKCIHPDHKIVGEESVRAFKNTNLLTATGEWNSRNQVKNYFVKVKERHMITKYKACAQYKSQESRPYMDFEVIKAILIVNGLMIGNCKYAEAFESINLIQ